LASATAASNAASVSWVKITLTPYRTTPSVMCHDDDDS
jgi:hypothetical protein